MRHERESDAATVGKCASARRRFAGIGALALALAAAGLAGCASDGGARMPPGFKAAAPVGIAPPPSAPPAPASTPYVADDLIGLTDAETEAIFGPPTVHRQEGLGVMKTYAFADCSLLLFLFVDTEGALTVQHADASARAAGVPRPDVNACLATAPARKALAEGDAAPAPQS